MVKSAHAVMKLEALEAFQRAKTVLAYWSIEGEVHTHAPVIRWAQHKRVALPMVENDSLVLGLFTGMDCMAPSPPFGILEPKSTPRVCIDEVDLVVVPGIAFDLHGNRLGRGKGYYDRLLRDVRAVKVGLCFNFQLVHSVPTDELDIRMDAVMSG